MRGYYDQGYINTLENGDTWLTQAWSGDIFQANQSGYPELKFVVPEEGVMLWHDNMMIPVGAADPLDAITYMDYVYEPNVAATDRELHLVRDAGARRPEPIVQGDAGRAGRRRQSARLPGRRR